MLHVVNLILEDELMYALYDVVENDEKLIQDWCKRWILDLYKFKHDINVDDESEVLKMISEKINKELSK